MSSTIAQALALLPLLLVTATAIAALLLAAFEARSGLIALGTAAGLTLALVALPFADRVTPLRITPLLIVDHAALFYTGLILSATLAVTGLCHVYFGARSRRCAELYILLSTAALGACVLVASAHFASLFLGLELTSVSLFALLAYTRQRETALEAGIKYLILSGVSSSFLLFGIALVYGQTGGLGFTGLQAALSAQAPESYLTAGLVLIVCGAAFKMSLFPFHMWTPDVYQGAPAPIAAFLATISKGAMFAVLLRYFAASGALDYAPVFWLVSLLAAGSMLAGNLLALLQENVKRILAYSSIAHFGYLLVALVAGGSLAVESAGYYLTAYFVSVMASFGIVTVLSRRGDAEDLERLADYRGLFWRRPWLAAVLTLMFLSLAGIPLTMGFIAKFYIFAAGIAASSRLLLATLIVGSGIGLFYYLRVIVALYQDPGDAAARESASVPVLGRLVLGALTALIIWLGIYPTPVMQLLGAAAFGTA